MYISISKSTSPNLYHHTQFIEKAVSSWTDVAKAVLSKRWSPIVWKDGYRCSANFQKARFCGLDIDHGTRLKGVIDKLKALEIGHVVGTTKSHQKEKKGVIYDCFRVVLMWEKEITCLHTYTHNVKLLIDKFGADPVTCDGGRMFGPCVEIVSIAHGKFLEVSPLPPRRLGRERYRAGLYAQDSGAKKPLTAEIEGFLNHGVLIGGGRNSTIFRVAGYLSWAGYSRREIEDLIQNAPIDRQGLGSREVTQAINNATRGSLSSGK